MATKVYFNCHAHTYKDVLTYILKLSVKTILTLRFIYQQTLAIEDATLALKAIAKAINIINNSMLDTLLSIFIIVLLVVFLSVVLLFVWNNPSIGTLFLSHYPWLVYLVLHFTNA